MQFDIVSEMNFFRVLKLVCAFGVFDVLRTSAARWLLFSSPMLQTAAWTFHQVGILFLI